MKTPFLALCCGILFAISSYALPVYHSIGEHGEARYSQLPPQGKYTVLHFYDHKPTPKPNTDKQRQCQTLRDNLVALSAGGAVNEVDAQGNQRALSADEIALRKSQTQAALQEHCQF